ncbi:DUF1217 domain-containing protein [Pseudooceanicola sp. MF1-13]|uniref:DUF1217 domain-containing protein n=1 Tax=Pseudooceanicola sp. MF1-13 TaxID=3379095 RepID=UPI003892BF49
MSFQPILAGSGVAAWNLLKSTMPTQTKVHDADPVITRDTEYFEAKIGDINTAEELVSDRRLLRVALGAFGLQDDINNRFFIKRILEDGVIKQDALANRLTDSRYKDLAGAFGFGNDATPLSKISDFGPKITEKFRRQQFEVAVGEQDQSLRLALNAERELGDLATRKSGETTKWLKVMGNAPLRQVFETALGLPSSFSQLDLDQQMEIFRDRADRQLGSGDIAQFSDPEQVSKLVQRFLLRSQVADIQASSSSNVALSLLQGAATFARGLSGR